MIVFLTTTEHAYTHRAVLEGASEIPVRLANYETIFGRTSVPYATYVFTDLDRLSYPELRLAADVYRCLRRSGLEPLNDPAQFRSRYGLLRALYLTGINGFNVYRVEEGVRPERWPVFVRSEGDHEHPVSDLLHDWDSVRRAIDAAIAAGRPLSSLIIVEYAAEPLPCGLFRKQSSFRAGHRGFGYTTVLDRTWLVKYGEVGLGTTELLEEELQMVRENPYAAVIEQAFAIGGVTYGRADFGLVDGRVQIYEINTNPEIKLDEDHPFPARVEGRKVFKANYLAALRAIDTPPSSDRVALTSPHLERFRRQRKRGASPRRR